MKIEFQSVKPRIHPGEDFFSSWIWQLKNSLSCLEDFERYFDLSAEERRGIENGGILFRMRTTPYYASLASPSDPTDPIRRILMPSGHELEGGVQQQEDPLGENKNRPAKRIIHRYSDRVLFLVTDFCSVYCRYCTRKHFTGHDQAVPSQSEYDEALSYIKKHTGIREVILSGGDPLTLSDAWLDRVMSDLRSIEHVEIIRLGTRMPVVCPMRVTEDLVQTIKKYQPVFLMTHFNHPREVTAEAKAALERFVDNGIPVFNQMVLLNGVNNHPAIVQALSRRLLFVRVKPYYMFQCDPSMGSDHFRTPVSQSLEIQRELWGHLSGLALPNLSLDIPDGGGKVALVPDFLLNRDGDRYSYRGWDGVEADYISPAAERIRAPSDHESYLKEWNELKAAKFSH